MTATTYHDQVLHTGLLFKRGSGVDYPFGRRNWKTCFFVLTPTALKYYKYEGGSWRGEVDLGAKKTKTGELLTSIDVMPVDAKKTGSSASTIWRIAVNTKDRRLLLSATSEMEMNLWVEKLNLALRINQGNRHELPSRSEPQDQRRHPRPHRMSLPDSLMMIGSANAFITDFPNINAPRRRVSIGGMGERASFSGYDMGADRQQPRESPKMTISKSSPELTAQAPEDFNEAIHRLLQSEFKSNNSIASNDNALSMDNRDQDDSSAVITTPPYLAARRQDYYHSERMSLPSSIDAQVFGTAPPPKSIADFHNFSRSRRRMSVENGGRLQRRFSVDAQPEWRTQRSSFEYEEEEKEEATGEKKEAGDAQPKPLSLERDDRRRRRFARFREWFSRH